MLLSHPLKTLIAALVGIGFAGAAQAQVLQDFTTGGAPDGTYGDASAGSGPDGSGSEYNFISGIDDGGTFTGVGGGSLGLDPTDHLFVTARLLPNSLNSTFRIILLEEDGAGTGEAWGYDADTSLLNESTFVTLDLGELSTGFDIGPNVGFGRAPGDGVFNIDAGTNTGLYEYQLQTTFSGDSANAIFFQVREVFVAPVVPEPTSLGLLSLLGVTAASLRRRV